MKQSRSPRIWLRRLLMGLSLCVFCGGCATDGGPAKRLCPVPSDPEIDSYEAVVRSGAYEPHVRWVGRLIAYCWPHVSELERDGR